MQASALPFLKHQFNSSFPKETENGEKTVLWISPYLSRCIIRGVTVSSPLVNSARRPRKPMVVNMTMERARLAPSYSERPLSNSNIGSESLKIQNMCRLLSHYTTLTFIHVPILRPRLSGLLKAHTFPCLILHFLPVRPLPPPLPNFAFKRAHCRIDSSPPPRSWSQTQVSFSCIKLSGLTLFCTKCLPSPSSTPFIPETFFNDHRTHPPTELAQILYFLFFSSLTNSLIID